jgi:alanyl aminopeptidase
MRIACACLIIACGASGHDAPLERGSAMPPGPRLLDTAAPLAYTVRLDVDPSVDHFDGHVEIRVRLAEPVDRIWLNLDEIDIVRARFRSEGGASEPLVQVDTGDEMRAFGFHRVLPPGELTIEIDYRGYTRHDQEGLFRQIAGKPYLYSQAESAFARRIVPCFDEPRWKVPWQVTLVVPPGQLAIANMPEVRETMLASGKREIEFAPSPPMASYLLAIAVGPFELVDVGPVGRRHVPVRVAALAATSGVVGVVKARLPAIVAAAEQLLDDDLPLAKLDVVAVPHLFGAMEHPGLVTFDQYVLAGDPNWPPVIRHFVQIAAHEIAHQWFGNLVTFAWWDDLWLGEAFATWLGNRIADQLGAYEDAGLRRALARHDALVADAEPDAKPLRPHIARADDAEQTFDAIAYDKGEAVLATIAAWQGEDVFLARLRAYLRARRGGTATARDLYAALGEPMAHALASYVERTGVPIVELALHCEGDHRALAAHVRGGLAVPVCVRYGDAVAGHRTCQLVEGRAEIALDGGCPTWVVGNDGAGYYDLAGPLVTAPPLAQLSHAELIAVGDDVADGFVRGEVSARDALAGIAQLAAARTLPAQLGALEIARAVDLAVDDATRSRWSAWLARRFDAVLQPGVLLTAGSPGDIAVREALIAVIAQRDLPAATVTAARVQLQRAKAIARPEDVVDWAAAQGDPVHAFDEWLASDDPLPTAWSWLDDLARPPARAVVWHAIEPHLKQVVARMDRDLGPLLDATTSLCDTAARGELAAAVKPVVTTDVDRRHLTRTLAAIDRCIARRGRAAEVAAALPP